MKKETDEDREERLERVIKMLLTAARDLDGWPIPELEVATERKQRIHFQSGTIRPVFSPTAEEIIRAIVLAIGQLPGFGPRTSQLGGERTVWVNYQTGEIKEVVGLKTIPLAEVEVTAVFARHIVDATVGEVKIWLARRRSS